MSQMKHSTHAVTLEVSYDQAFAYLSDWHNQPKWAINFVKGIRQEGEQIIMTAPFGDVPIQWRADRTAGTIDIVFPGNSVLPTRLVAIGDSLVYTFTFSVPTNMPDAEFLASQQGMEEELHQLKRILEKSA